MFRILTAVIAMTVCAGAAWAQPATKPAAKPASATSAPAKVKGAKATPPKAGTAKAEAKAKLKEDEMSSAAQDNPTFEATPGATNNVVSP